MPEPADQLGLLWGWFAQHQFRGYSPLYERIAGGVAHSPEVLDLVREAPPDAHLPPVLLGAVHYLLLAGLDHPLAEVYAGRSAADPVSLFVEVCHTYREDILALMAVRRVQTNDCGRCALIIPGLRWIASRMAGPTALIDVGASAGLNLIGERYRIDYGSHGVTGPARSPVEIRCEVIGGDPPITPTLPPFVSRTGLDQAPIDLADPDDARWLLACVWPDTGRLERTAASIGLAQQSLPEVRTGDAVEDLPRMLAEVADGTAVVVMNTWSYSYLVREQRSEYLTALEEASHRRPVAWLVADDGSALGEAEVWPDGVPEEHVLGAVLFTEAGGPRGRVLATVQQHGAWMDWIADS